MDRDSLLRTAFIALILLGGYWFFFGRKATDHPQSLPPEHYVSAPGFVPDALDAEPAPTAPGTPAEACTSTGNRFQAEFTSHGAGLTHFLLTDARYASSDGHDVSTTPDIERWHNLRTLFRDETAPQAPDDQVKFDRFDWKTESLGGQACRFTYEDPGVVRIVKTVSADGAPFELAVETTISNLAAEPRKHQTSVELFAYRKNKEVKGRLGRVSPFQTNLECARGKDVKRLNKGADEFKTGWFSEPMVDRYTAIANYYFAQALVPVQGTTDDKPACDLGDEQWYGAGQASDDDDAGDVYKARLTYPKRALGPNESVTYKQVAYFGPKERNVLAAAAAAGGSRPQLQDLINLGFFSFVAKFLVSVIIWIHTHITMGNWGLAIIVLTLGLRTVLFPLTWKQIQSAVAMRRLKPEIDVINAKFKDDAQAKNLAMMELWRKHKVNPLGGCAPALVQMPIWFALYATLQTAVEFYHTKFLWFQDLSAPDPFFVLPIVLGAAMIMQQRIVPQQGMDAMQAKMMMWLMPGVFTVMMLFLPAALGVYMLTNSLLGITQQLVTEKVYPRAGGPGAASAAKGDDIVVKRDTKDGGPATAAALRKGKARV